MICETMINIQNEQETPPTFFFNHPLVQIKGVLHRFYTSQGELLLNIVCCDSELEKFTYLRESL